MERRNIDLAKVADEILREPKPKPVEPVKEDKPKADAPTEDVNVEDADAPMVETPTDEGPKESPSMLASDEEQAPMADENHTDDAAAQQTKRKLADPEGPQEVNGDVNGNGDAPNGTQEASKKR